MPLPAIVGGAIIAGGASLLGQGASAYAQGRMNKKTRQFAKDMYNQQRADSLADWQMQTEYENPSAQMQRLRDAKINPNLVFGDTITSNAPSVKPASMPSWSPEPPRYSGAAVGESLTQIYDLKLREAQTNNLAKTAELIEAQKIETMAKAMQVTQDVEIKNKIKDYLIEAAQIANVKTHGDIERGNYERSIMLRADQRAQLLNASSIAEAAARMSRIAIENAKTKEEINHIKEVTTTEHFRHQIEEKELELRKANIHPGTPGWFRAFQLFWKNITE